MATREAKMLQQMLDPNQPNPGESDLPTATVSKENEFVNPGGEIELTDDIKSKVPVINNARNSNKMSGMADFLSNPVVQNALMQFGRAFADGREGEAGTVLADAGQQFLQRNANQSALEAAEAGEPIAEAAGQFADPEMVAGLQQRQQQQEQFEKEMTLAEDGLEIDRDRLNSDESYRVAKLAQDKEFGKRRLANLEEQSRIDRVVGEARANLLNAQADAVGQGEGGLMSIDPDRIEKYNELLNQQEQIYNNSVDQLEQQLEDMRDPGFVAKLYMAGTKQPPPPNLIREGDYEEYSRVKRQHMLAQEKVAQIQETKGLLLNVAQANLQGGGVGGASTKFAEGTQGQGNQQVQGTKDSPVQASLAEAKTMAPGSVVSIFGTTYRINEDGTKTPLEDESE